MMMLPEPSLRPPEPTCCVACGESDLTDGLHLSDVTDAWLCSDCVNALRGDTISEATRAQIARAMTLADGSTSLCRCRNCWHWAYDDSMDVPKCLYCEHSECCGEILKPGQLCTCEVRETQRQFNRICNLPPREAAE